MGRWEHHHDNPDDPAIGEYRDDRPGVEGLVVTERDDYRLAALEGAIRLVEQSTHSDPLSAVIAHANVLYGWLTGVTLELDVVSVTEQGSGLPVQPQFTPGGALQLTDTEQFTASVVAKDAKGNVVPDTLTWTADDNGAVVTLAPSADTLSCLIVAVAPGTANYTASDGTLSVTGQAVVGAGAPADLVLTEGVAEPQTPAAPAAPAAPAPS